MQHAVAHRRVQAAEVKAQLVSMTTDRNRQAAIWGMHDSHTRPLLKLDDPQQRLGAVISAEVIAARTGGPVTASTLASVVKKMAKPTKRVRPPVAPTRTKCPMCTGTGWLSAAIAPA